MRKKWKRKVPEVLWRIYRNRARTLAETIVALLPQQPPPTSSSSSSKKCRCRGKGCLGCSGGAAPMSFLLRPGDPSDYTRLLTRGYAVVSDAALHFSAITFARRWSIKEIVERTIETMLYKKETSYNVLCIGYDKHTQSSKVVDLLTTSAWSLLHNRMGDEFMVHILKFLSIFLPLAREDHCQVSGFPIKDLCSNFSKGVTSVFQGPSPDSCGNQDLPQKRRRIDTEGKFNLKADISLEHSLGLNSSVGSVNCHVDCSQRSYLRQCNRSCQMSISEAKRPSSSSGFIFNHVQNETNKELPQRSNQENPNSKKRTRPFSWQRQRKRRKLNFAEALTSPTSTTCTISEKDAVNREQIQNMFTSFNHHPVKTAYLKESEKEPTSELCFCFWMLKALRKIPCSTQIDRKSLFYKSYSSSYLFPRNHILNTSKNNDVGAISVFKDIFGLSDESLISNYLSCQTCHFCVKGSPCLFHSILQLIKRLIRNVRGCRYMDLMDKHCQVPMIEEECNLPLEKSNCGDRIHRQSQRTSSVNGYQFGLNRSCCVKSQVVSFIWAVCRRIIPLELLGPPSNWRSLRRNISKFVYLRKFETFSLKQCMHGLKSSYVPLLSNEYSSCYLNNHVPDRSEDILNGCQKFGRTKALLKNNIFTCWIFWLFSRIIGPMVQANFYVTDVEGGKLDTFYFQKPYWEKLCCGYVGVEFLKKHNYDLLSEETLLSILKKSSLGFSKVRFLPKENGVRLLANLKVSSKYVQRDPPVQRSFNKGHYKGMQGQVLNFMPVNKVLRDLTAVLKGLKKKHPEKLGSSVFDYNDVYSILAPFITHLKNGSKKMPKVFVVICDISKAFDCINQGKLINVMQDVITDEEYILESFHEAICTKKSLWVHPHQMLLDENMSATTTRSRTSIPFHVLHRVQIIQEKNRIVRKAHLLRHLYDHVKCNVLRYENCFYLQGGGIAQGSAVSSLLCSYYFANMEKKVIFPFLQKIQEFHIFKPSLLNLSGRFICEDNGAVEEGVELIEVTDHDHVILRFIDDFLFISTSKKYATQFFSRLRKGVRDYNCFINEAKSSMNFDAPCASKYMSNKMYKGDDGTSFLPWSGLLINAHTLEIQADYTRYVDTHLSSTLTVRWQDKPGCHLKEKLRHYMQPKCHPIFYDSNINSARVVRLNVYQAFLLCSMKFHCYICDLSSICTLRTGQHFEIITSSLRYMYRLIKRRMHSTNVRTHVRPILQLKRKEVIWLGLNAYIRVLKKKLPRHSRLVSLLESELLKFRMGRSASLKYAIDDSHSSLFWKIKY